jgi:TatD DNase family protein
MGCWFSVNEMQASTRRAKEQLKLIPQDKLLFETDLPPQQGEPFSAEQIKASLERAQALVASIRGA